MYTFGWYMRRYIEETRAKGATPIVLSPTVRNIWKGITVERGPGSYAEWSAAVAREAGAAFLPVTDAIADRYEDLGPDAVKKFFPEDHTHTNPEGAALTASIVADTMKTPPAYPPEIPEARLKLTRPRDPKLPTIFLIGDSTVRNGYGDGANGQWGWGEPLVDRFDTAKLNLVNRAVGGLSSRTYLTQGHWAHVLTMLKPGDYVVMQFGHNDNGPLDDAARARGTIAGIGDETREIDNPITKKARNRPHLRLVSAALHRRRAGQRRRPDRLLAHPAEDVEGREDRPARHLPEVGAGGRGGRGRPFIDLHELIANPVRRDGRNGGRPAVRRRAHPHQPRRRGDQRRHRRRGPASVRS